MYWSYLTDAVGVMTWMITRSITELHHLNNIKHGRKDTITHTHIFMYLHNSETQKKTYRTVPSISSSNIIFLLHFFILYQMI